MQYRTTRRAAFLQRPNRFVALCDLDGETVRAHVKNTGRCRELLVPGCTVYLEESGNPNRSTAYSLIGVEKGNLRINMDSQAPNRIFQEGVEQGIITLPEMAGYTLLKGEQTFRHSRFDFYWESPAARGFVEIKGVTLEEGGRAYFPDAPTERGIKHLQELSQAVGEGYCGSLVFIVQMKGVASVTPNWATHPAFGLAVQAAQQAGVAVHCYDCQVGPDRVRADTPVPFLLDMPHILALE